MDKFLIYTMTSDGFSSEIVEESQLAEKLAHCIYFEPTEDHIAEADAWLADDDSWFVVDGGLEWHWQMDFEGEQVHIQRVMTPTSDMEDR